MPDRGKVLTAEQLEKMDKFYRYLDVDGDGIPYRTLPGVHPKGAYFTRGSGHTKYGAYTEDAAAYQDVLDRLLVKWETARSLLPKADIRYSKFNKAGILTLGSGDGACTEALDRLAKLDVHLNYCRVKSFPFGDEVREFIEQHDVVYVVEQNRDAQLRTLLINDIEADQKKLVPMLHYNGMPINSGFVADKVLEEILSRRPPPQHQHAESAVCGSRHMDRRARTASARIRPGRCQCRRDGSELRGGPLPNPSSLRSPGRVSIDRRPVVSKRHRLRWNRARAACRRNQARHGAIAVRWLPRATTIVDWLRTPIVERWTARSPHSCHGDAVV